jgi:hypothetical protein
MYSLAFLAYAVLQAALFVWLWRVWRRTGLAVAAMLLIPQFFLIWDNLIVGIGRYIGFGELLEALSWPRFWAHWISGGWLTIAAGSILRLADIDWAKRAVVMGAFCVVATLGILYDLPYFWTKDLVPVCEYDLIRYSVQVSEATRCSVDQPLVSGGPPLVPIMTCLIVIGAGAVLAIKRRFPWLMVGGILMFVSATPWFARFKLDNLGEVCIAGGAIWAIAHFVRQRSAANGTLLR